MWPRRLMMTYQCTVCVLSYSNKDHRFGGSGATKCSTHSHHALLTCWDRLVGVLSPAGYHTGWDGRLGVLYVTSGDWWRCEGRGR